MLHDSAQQAELPLPLSLFPLSLSASVCLFASGPFQSGKAAANCLTPDLADNTTTETDDSHELQGQWGFTAGEDEGEGEK